ncbi:MULTISPECIES: hypothetical protein [unclassified Rhizobium]|uniref:hypothetical protein n=1 Tax=unclassified Rhizobium TaxID=2613769 RepID=UPI001ADD5985|nr:MULTISPECIES: hypothetical protein [unclassified Rhizobium]MBO9101723.1 hypothetical protein [Rhizobium sp. L58/93]QXZ87159.1 hypothetical protein J5287_21545 [Rhizobium sp. K1/93]QXZ92808.1 hypothetical protein J5280_19350 [Rhizobium sp. K15/93]QYA03971.1 hypothetical protein J5278_24720 [Rhizobium sp. B21/90]
MFAEKRLEYACLIAAVLIAAISLYRSIGYAISLSHPLYYWDHFGYFDAFRNWRVNGWDTWSFIHMTHNEHRLGLTKLTMLADLWLTRGSNVVLQVTTYLTLFASGALLIGISAIGMRRRYLQMLALLGGVSMVGVVSLGNLAWPTQVQFGYAQLIPVVLMVVAFQPALKWPGKAVVLLLCIVSTETMASGILAPVAGLISALVFARDVERSAMMAIGSVLAIVYYLIPTAHDFPVGPTHGFGADNFIYFLAALGNWTQQAGTASAIYTGALLGFLALVFGAIGILGARLRGMPFTVLLSVAIYAGASIAAMAVNRGTAGNPDWALTSRYSSPSILFALSLAGIILRYGLVTKRNALSALAAIFLLAIVGFSNFSDRAIAEGLEINRQRDEAAALMLRGDYNAEIYKKIYPSPQVLLQIVDFMRERHYGLFRSAN